MRQLFFETDEMILFLRLQIVGSPKSAAAAKQELLEKKVEWEARSFEVKIEVDPEFHPKIIGKWSNHENVEHS